MLQILPSEVPPKTSYVLLASRTRCHTHFFSQLHMSSRFLGEMLLYLMPQSSSTIVRFCMSLCSRETKSKFTAFYFFSFADAAKQTSIGLIKSLIWQFLGHVAEVPRLVQNLYSSSEGREPHEAALLDILKALIEEFEDVFLVIDALDESSERAKSVAALKRIHEWNLEGMHILVTSRDEPDLRSKLKSIADDEVSAQNDGVKDDIALYIERRLQKDEDLLKWSQHHSLIQNALVNGAQGMFRWCECRKLARSGTKQSQRSSR